VAGTGVTVGVAVAAAWVAVGSEAPVLPQPMMKITASNKTTPAAKGWA